MVDPVPLRLQRAVSILCRTGDPGQPLYLGERVLSILRAGCRPTPVSANLRRKMPSIVRRTCHACAQIQPYVLRVVEEADVRPAAVG